MFQPAHHEGVGYPGIILTHLNSATLASKPAYFPFCLEGLQIPVLRRSSTDTGIRQNPPLGAANFSPHAIILSLIILAQDEPHMQFNLIDSFLHELSVFQKGCPPVSHQVHRAISTNESWPEMEAKLVPDDK